MSVLKEFTQTPDFYFGNLNLTQAEADEEAIKRVRRFKQPDTAFPSPSTANLTRIKDREFLQSYDKWNKDRGVKPFAAKAEAQQSIRNKKLEENLPVWEGLFSDEGFEDALSKKGLKEDYDRMAKVYGETETLKAEFRKQIFLKDLTGRRDDLAQVQIAKGLLEIDDPTDESFIQGAKGWVGQQVKKREDTKAGYEAGVQAFLKDSNESSLFDLWKDQKAISKEAGESFGAAYRDMQGSYSDILPLVKQFIRKTQREEGVLPGTERIGELEGDKLVEVYQRGDRDKFLYLLSILKKDAGSDVDDTFGKVVTSIERGFSNIIDPLTRKVIRFEETLTREEGAEKEADYLKHARQILQDTKNLDREIARVEGSNMVTQGIYDSLESLPYMGLMASPAGMSLAGLSIQEEHMERIREIDPSVSEEDALWVATFSAPIEVGIEKLQFMALGGRFPGLQKVVDKIAKGGIVRRILSTTAGEYTQETIQDAVLPSVMDIVGTLNEEMPHGNWDDYKAMDARRFFAVLPLAVLGGGGQYARDKFTAAEASTMLQDETHVRMSGGTIEEAREIAEKAKTDPDAALEMYRDKVLSKSMEERGKIGEEAFEKILEQDLPEGMEDVPYVYQNKDGGYKINYNNGQTEVVESAEEANLKLDDFFKKEFVTNIESFKATTEHFMEKAEGDNKLEQKKIRSLQEIADKGEETVQELEKAVVTMLAQTGQPIPSKIDLNEFMETGSVSLRREMAGYTVRLAKGKATPDTVVEEFSEGFLKLLVAKGGTSYGEVKTLLDDFGVQAGINMTEGYDVASDRAVIEGFSKFVRAYALQGKHDSLPSETRSWFDKAWDVLQDPDNVKPALRAYVNFFVKLLKPVFDVAQGIKQAVSEGSLNQDLETLAKGALGINEEAIIKDLQTKANKDLEKDLGVKIPRMNARKSFSIDYQGNHQPAMNDSGAPGHDLSEIYPDDIYGPNGARYYGHAEPYDQRSIDVIRRIKGKPEAVVTIYRAIPSEFADPKARAFQLEEAKKTYLKRGNIPKKFDDGSKNGDEWYDWASEEVDRLNSVEEITSDINAGDWVTINRAYAKEHGEAVLRGDYEILSKKVKAKEIFTEGNSIHEWGYDPIGGAGSTFAVSQKNHQEDILDAIDRIFDGPKGVIEIGKKLRGKLAKIRKRHEDSLIANPDKATREMDTLNALIQLNAIASVLPSEVRGEVGSPVPVISLKSQKARGRILIKKLDKIALELDKHLQKKLREKIRRGLDKSGFKLSDSRRRKGKIGKIGHEVIDQVGHVMKMDLDSAETEKSRLNKEFDEIEDPQTEDFERWDSRTLATDLFYDYENATTSRLEQAYEFITTNYKEGRKEWLAILKNRKEERDQFVTEAISFMGDSDRVWLEDLTKAENKSKGVKERAGEGLAEFLFSNHHTLARIVENAKDKESARKWYNKLLDSRIQGDMKADRESDEKQQAFFDKVAEIIGAKGALKGHDVRKWLYEAKRTRKNQITTLEGKRNEKVSVDKHLVESLLRGEIAKIDGQEFSSADIDALSRQWEKFEDLTEKQQNRVKKVKFDRVTAQGERRPIGELSQAEALQWWLTMRQPDQREKLESMGWDGRTMTEIEDFLSSDVKAVGIWMSNDLVKDGKILSDVHAYEFGIGLKTGENYFPVRNRIVDQPIQMDMNDPGAGRTISPGSLKERVVNRARPAQANAFGTYFQHVTEMAYWKHNVGWVRQYGGAMRTKAFSEAMESKVGKHAANALQKYLGAVQNRGVNAGRQMLAFERLVKSMLSRVSLAVLGSRVSTMWINATAFVNAMASPDVSAAAVLKNMIKMGIDSKGELKASWRNELAVMRRRYGASFEAQLAMKSGNSGHFLIQDAEKLAQKGLVPMNVIDVATNTLTMAAIYRTHYDAAIKRGESEQEARDFADTGLTRAHATLAQPTLSVSRSMAEMGTGQNPFLGIFTMFMSEVRKNAANNFVAWRTMVTGKGIVSRMTAARQAAVYTLVYTGIVQAARGIYKSLTGDDDEVEEIEAQLRDPKFWTYAIASDNLRAVPLLGDASLSLMAGPLDQKYWDQKTPLSRVVNQWKQADRIFDEENTDSEKIDEVIDQMQSWGSILPGGAIFAQAANVAEFTKDVFENGMGNDLTKSDRISRIRREISQNKTEIYEKFETQEERWSILEDVLRQYREENPDEWGEILDSLREKKIIPKSLLSNE